MIIPYCSFLTVFAAAAATPRLRAYLYLSYLSVFLLLIRNLHVECCPLLRLTHLVVVVCIRTHVSLYMLSHQIVVAGRQAYEYAVACSISLTVPIASRLAIVAT